MWPAPVKNSGPLILEWASVSGDRLQVGEKHASVQPSLKTGKPMLTSLVFAAAAAAKSLQSCPTLCDPIDVSTPGSAVPGILQAKCIIILLCLHCVFCFINPGYEYDFVESQVFWQFTSGWSWDPKIAYFLNCCPFKMSMILLFIFLLLCCWFFSYLPCFFFLSPLLASISIRFKRLQYPIALFWPSFNSILVRFFFF